MDNTICHIEIAATDLKKAGWFHGRLFFFGSCDHGTLLIILGLRPARNPAGG